jgi:tripartite-type tricarboxylate transporter receptor subunit TctC
MSMSKSLVVIPVAALLMAGASWAQDSEPDFGRPGWYVGVGAGGGFDFFEKAIEDATGGEITSSPTGSSTRARGIG